MSAARIVRLRVSTLSRPEVLLMPSTFRIFLLAGLLLAATPALAADYLQAAGSTLGFSGTLDGERFEGRFPGFATRLQFDPAKLDQARLEVTIPLAGATTGNRDHDAEMRGQSLLNVRKFAQARYTASRFRALGGNRYAGDGVLSLQGDQAGDLRSPGQPASAVCRARQRAPPAFGSQRGLRRYRTLSDLSGRDAGGVRPGRDKRDPRGAAIAVIDGRSDKLRESEHDAHETTHGARQQFFLAIVLLLIGRHGGLLRAMPAARTSGGEKPAKSFGITILRGVAAHSCGCWCGSPAQPAPVSARAPDAASSGLPYACC